MSGVNDNVLQELSALQRRVDELKVLLRNEIVHEAFPGETFSIVVARTENETIGVLAANVEEVVPTCRLTVVPDCEPWFAGLLNLGGTMAPVLDLSTRISGVEREGALSDMILICKSSGGRIGLIVKEIVGIHEMTGKSVQTVLGTLARAPYLLGTTEIEKKTVLLLNLAGLFSEHSLPGDGAP